ncbi:MAG: hypothetical protein L3J83_11340 [Proteobacteria bacterium]|nr:hypothetical protein [Pseudomonadota bacterium]
MNKISTKSVLCILGLVLLTFLPLIVSAQLTAQTTKILTTVSQPRLNPQDRISQSDIEDNKLSLKEIRKAGMLVFSTPFNKHDGFGDGTPDLTIFDNLSPGNRPTLQGNNTFLRVNGLDAQTCLECHSILSNATVPARLGVGGVGGVSQNALFQPTNIDVADSNNDGIADFNGRFINPPFLFGSGGVELIGMEMTVDLQNLKNQAINSPNTTVVLTSKGIDFGSIVADVNGNIDTSNIKGVNNDLVVKPFGRKGEFATVREFAVGAMSFHFGMQATELVGVGVDEDNDGIVDELKTGDMSALSIFNSTMNRPVESKRNADEEAGFELFNDIGCASCHTPQLNTQTRILPYKLIGENQAPFENTYYSVDLSKSPSGFKKNNQGGIVVNLYSDLKHHFMGEHLKESFSLATDKQNGEYITARLWGIADTAPYLQDGRALTLEDAIELHDNPGSAASAAGQNFKTLGGNEKINLIKFLNTLRTPPRPNLDVLPRIEMRLQN